ncbi:helix-turn-helix domain-containing protein (plasmid) [Streptomyces sp. JL4002]|uniref:helix-turn-helix domain-containing protein n=1 Tax=Streptomyces sp. JL4002 TaxID=3404781 RepID=UPI003B27E3FF
MTHSPDTGIGARVRVARIAAGLTQAEMAGLVGRSERWAEDVEAGRLPLDRYSLITAVATVCEVDVVWLLGQPYRLRREQGSAVPHVPALRAALRRSSLILSGHPGLVPSGPATDAQSVRDQAAATNRHRQGANLPAVAGLLPGLLEDLNTTILMHERGTAEWDEALRLLVDAARNARQTLNQTGLPDLAWVAAEVAAGAATHLDDPIVKAAVAWDRCGALLHQGSARETQAVADAALRDLEPISATGDTDALVLEGALVLRQVVACARAGDADGAWSQATRALEVSGRLPDGHHDLRWQTVFSRANVLVHTTEAGVEVDAPETGLSFVDDADVAGMPSRERITHYRIDEARAMHRMGRSGDAVVTLRAAAQRAPHYVHAHPMARGLVGDMVRRGVPSQAAALSGLVRGMELVS